jgi:hypothetical protein
MAYNIQNFKSNLGLGGARPTLFKVLLTAPSGAPTLGDFSTAEFMIQASSLPGSTIGSIDVPYFGRKIRVAGDRTFEPWSVQVLNDEDFKVRDSLERWHNTINSLEGNLGKSSPANYKADAEVIQYSKDGKEIRTYSFIGLFPTEISPIELSWNDTDTIETFSTTFMYDYYTIFGDSEIK